MINFSYFRDEAFLDIIDKKDLFIMLDDISNNCHLNRINLSSNGGLKVHFGKVEYLYDPKHTNMVTLNVDFIISTNSGETYISKFKNFRAIDFSCQSYGIDKPILK